MMGEDIKNVTQDHKMGKDCIQVKHGKARMAKIESRLNLYDFALLSSLFGKLKQFMCE